MSPVKKDARTRLLDAALRVIRTKGYAATTVDELCQAAGVTKGAFFHHFRSKEELAVAAAGHFGEMAETLFAGAGYRGLPSARERVMAYVDLREAILSDDLPDVTCLLGTLVQEVYDTHPAIRAACEREIVGHALRLEADMAAALAQAGRHGIDPRGLALFVQSVLQGSFVLAKATGGPAAATESIGHLRRYLEQLFSEDGNREKAA